MTMNDMNGSHSECKSRPRATHVGTYRIGDIALDCAVLEDGRRGYVQRSLRQAIGIRKNIPVPHFLGFLADMAPNALKYMGESGSPTEIIMPHGGHAKWVSSGILTEICGGVIDHALDGTLGAKRAHLLAPCRALYKALARTGEEALIDEATGYQYAREPNALQDLISRLICEAASDWKQRFHPEYYAALCKLFGFEYGNQHRPLPGIIGKITLEQVYMIILPADILAELKARQKSEKLHQWLKADGLTLLERQRDAVMMIARSSTDYRDFEARCSVAFYRPGVQTKMVFPAGQIGRA